MWARLRPMMAAASPRRRRKFQTEERRRVMARIDEEVSLETMSKRRRGF